MTQTRRFARLAILAAFAAGSALAHESPAHHATALVAVGAEADEAATVDPAVRLWLAGDHHVHSRYSVGWTPDPAGGPPTPEIAGDAIYPIPTNAAMAARYGLSWMVSTDHGGPNHSKVNRDMAYPELQRSRAEVPGLIQFYGMEFDTPGADHSSLIIPHTPDERDVLEGIESRFAKHEPWPSDPSWNTEPRMLEALRHMREIEQPPVVIANHPSRSANGDRTGRASCATGTTPPPGWPSAWRGRPATRPRPCSRTGPSSQRAPAAAIATARPWAALTR